MVTLVSLIPAAGAGVAIGCRLVRAGVRRWHVLAAFCDIIDGLLARQMGVVVGRGRGGRRRRRPLRRVLLLRRARLLLPRSRSGPVHRARRDHRLLHGQLHDGQGRGDGCPGPARRDAPGRARRLPDDRRGIHAARERIVRPLSVAGLRELPILLALSIVAVVANISVVQRLLAIATLLREREAAEKSTTTSAAAFDDEAMATKPDVPVGMV